MICLGLAEALGGFAGALGDALNAVHNENASSPAVVSMIGRQTGLLGTDALNFTGAATVAITDSAGDAAPAPHHRLRRADHHRRSARRVVSALRGGTIDAFADALNTALGGATPAGTATFADGVLSLNVAQRRRASSSSRTPPIRALRAGRGFSHFFGLNDLVSRPTPMFFESGVSGSDLHGLNSGGAISYQVRDAAGRFIADRTVTISGALAAPGADLGRSDRGAQRHRHGPRRIRLVLAR